MMGGEASISGERLGDESSGEGGEELESEGEGGDCGCDCARRRGERRSEGGSVSIERILEDGDD